jgi:tetratricopeptide (TPR) repeat protein
MSTGTSTLDELWARLDRIRELPDGRGQAVAHDELIRAADAQGDPELRFLVRLSAVEAYVDAGEHANALAPFAWCLAVFDRGEAPPRATHTLLWSYKWIVGALPSFPEVPLAHTRAALDDMERRYLLHGHSLNPVHQYREALERHLGDRAAADEQFRLWQAAPRGSLSDCAGCEPDDIVDHLTWVGRIEDAVELGDRALAGELRCHAQPHGLLATMMEPYLRAGRGVEAARAHRRAYRAHRTRPAMLARYADHLRFCVLSGNPARGLEILERHLPELDAPPNPAAEMHFCAAAAALLEGVDEAMQLRRGDADITAGALRSELVGRARDIAARFDERNGTTAQSERIAEVLALTPIVDALPLSEPARRPAAARPVPTAGDATDDATDDATPEPATAEELAELAELCADRGDHPGLHAAWQRFDELCPEPHGLLRARRLRHAAHDAVLGGSPDQARDLLDEAGRILVAEGADDGTEGDAVRASRVRVLASVDRADEAAAVAAELLARAEDSGDVDRRSRARRSVVVPLLAEERFAEALPVLDEALALGPSDLEAGKLHRERVLVLLRLGPERHEEAVAAAERAQQLLEAAGAGSAVPGMQMALGSALGADGDPAVAYRILGEIEIPAGLTEWRADRGLMRGQLGLHLGHVEAARVELLDAVAGFTAVGDERAAALAKVDLAVASQQAGHLDDAADAAEDAIAALSAVDDESVRRARYVLAQVSRDLGEIDEALHHYGAAAQAWSEVGHPYAVGQLNAEAAAMLDRVDRDAEAAQHHAAAAAAYAAAEEPFLAAGHRRGAALSWNWARVPDAALQELAATDAAVAELEATASEEHRTSVEWHRAMARHDGARILWGAGRLDEAIARIEGAAAILRSLGEPEQAAATGTLHGRMLVAADRAEEARAVLTRALDDLPEDAADRRAEVLDLMP